MNPKKTSFARRWLALALVSVSVSKAFADGELDLSFEPPPELGSNYLGLTLIHEQAYVYGHQFKIQRLQDDGSLDTDWRLAAPVETDIYAVAGLPAGGVAAAGTSLGLYFDHGDGTFTRSFGGGALQIFATRLLPQDDGSLVIVDLESVSKVMADGSRDPVFRNKVRLETIGGSGNAFVGGSDSHGRVILGGSLRAAAPAERIALIRLLADGSMDTGWNPAPELGLNTDSGNLNSRPLALTVLPDDSVIVIMEKEVVWIDAQGKVVRRSPNLAKFNSLFAPPVVQPDGKIIVGGNFFKWGEVPVSGLIRLNVDGTLDSSFNAQVKLPFIDTLALDSRGRLWLSGTFREVNGVARPGVARIFAFNPGPVDPVAPSAIISDTQPRVGTKEVLYLTADVNGVPAPALQWFRNGTPIANATNRGLRLNITNATDVGLFSLVASNLSGAHTLTFPPISVAVRSPHPGTEDLAFSRVATNFLQITQLLPLPDGRVLVAGGSPGFNPHPEGNLVGRLLTSGGLDPSFGQGGVIDGVGYVETVIPLPGGGLLVAGNFAILGGQPAHGLAELDASGHRVARAFPNLDIAHVSAVLPLPDGKLMIAGRFTRVNDVPAYRIARLNSDLTLDTSFQGHLLDWQFVDAFALDAHGRVLMAGERVYANATVRDPALVGLQRLLPDGSPDPAFHARTAGVRTIFMEPEGRMLVGMPAARLDEDGNVLTVFEDTRFPYARSGDSIFRAAEPNHLMIRTADGGVIYQSLFNTLPDRTAELWRWKPTGERDYAFRCVLATNVAINLVVNAMALQPDNSVLLGAISGPAGDGVQQLRRIPRDPDLSLRTKDLTAGQFHVALETQPGMSYEVYQRDQVTGGTATKLGEYSGDGYVLELQAPATGNSTFLELRRH